ncbi:MAG: hypothetical protein KDD44_04495 [Bdellovibrionales bacterium]|nr:hypothetical protein [Bdellovibrionales bacterium]
MVGKRFIRKSTRPALAGLSLACALLASACREPTTAPPGDIERFGTNEFRENALYPKGKRPQRWEGSTQGLLEATDSLLMPANPKELRKKLVEARDGTPPKQAASPEDDTLAPPGAR